MKVCLTFLFTLFMANIIKCENCKFNTRVADNILSIHIDKGADNEAFQNEGELPKLHVLSCGALYKLFFRDEALKDKVSAFAADKDANALTCAYYEEPGKGKYILGNTDIDQVINRDMIITMAGVAIDSFKFTKADGEEIQAPVSAWEAIPLSDAVIENVTESKFKLQGRIAEIVNTTGATEPLSGTNSSVNVHEIKLIV